MKKFIVVFLASLMMYSVTFGAVKIEANEFLGIENIEDSEAFVENFDIEIEENDESRTVTVFDKTTKETSIAIYDKKTGIIKDEKGNIFGKSYVIETRSTSGPFTAYYDINPQTVGAIIGAILAIGAIVSLAATAGLSIAVLKSGLSTLFQYGSTGSLLHDWFSGVSVNGYLSFSQEYNDDSTKARNLNRRIYARVGYSNSYNYYSFGNGSWFRTVRP